MVVIVVCVWWWVVRMFWLLLSAPAITRYYLATATLELEQHYHLLRTLSQGSGPSGRRRVWSHAHLTRSDVQHSKLEAIKSLARVRRCCCYFFVFVRIAN